MKNRNNNVKTILSAKNPALRLSQILNQLMEECHIDGVQLSKNTGVPTTTINRLRNADANNNPTLTTLVPLATFFSITVSQLIGDEAIPKERKSGSYFSDVKGWDYIPHLSWEQAAEWPDNRIKIDLEIEKWTTTDLNLNDNSFSLTMIGDSMYPRFPEGTLLVIEPAQMINNRDFVLMLPERQSKPLFKQVLIDGADYYVKSLNKDFKEIKKITLDDNKIIGVMRQAKMEF